MADIKICLNCGDNLLEQARKCPTCGKKDLLLLDRNEVEKIKEIKSNVPNPKGGSAPKWKTNLELKSQIWSNSKENQKKVIVERKQTADANGIACCPKCGFTSLSGNKQGFGVGKAYFFGLLAGTINSKKVIITCLKCGYQWKAGKQ